MLRSKICLHIGTAPLCRTAVHCPGSIDRFPALGLGGADYICKGLRLSCLVNLPAKRACHADIPSSSGVKGTCSSGRIVLRCQSLYIGIHLIHIQLDLPFCASCDPGADGCRIQYLALPAKGVCNRHLAAPVHGIAKIF